MPVSLYTTLDDPLATQGTLVWGVNAAGQIVGYYFDSSNHTQGFLLSGGTPLSRIRQPPWIPLRKA